MISLNDAPAESVFFVYMKGESNTGSHHSAWIRTLDQLVSVPNRVVLMHRLAGLL